MIFGERVRQAREFRGLTQVELARRVGLGQPAIAHMETGRTHEPSDEALQRLSMQLGFPRSFFELPPAPDFPEGSLLYRARRAVTAREKAQSHRYSQLIYEQVLAVGQKVTMPGPVRLPSTRATIPRGAAELTRSALGLGPDRPIPNLVNVLERGGVLILALPKTATFARQDAFSAWTMGSPSQPVIVVTSHPPGERQQFSVAHEVGHLVMHHPPQGAIHVMEEQADQFASELLMPRAGIMNEFRAPINLSRLLQLKSRWHVSVQALARRARDLGVIADGEYRYLNQQISARGWKKQEPGSFPATRPRAVKKMFELAYGEPLDVRAIATAHRLSTSTMADILDAHASKADLLTGGRVTYADHPKLVQLRRTTEP
jgi:Zn-dependent peptidase ImmA (M78 family)/transcriptional regulator with XRE-family HTH domain